MQGNLSLWIIRSRSSFLYKKQLWKKNHTKHRKLLECKDQMTFYNLHIWICKLPPKPHSSMFIVRAWGRRRWLVAMESSWSWAGLGGSVLPSPFSSPAAWLCSSAPGLYFLITASSCWHLSNTEPWPQLLLLLQLCIFLHFFSFLKLRYNWHVTVH